MMPLSPIQRSSASRLAALALVLASSCEARHLATEDATVRDSPPPHDAPDTRCTTNATLSSLEQTLVGLPAHSWYAVPQTKFADFCRDHGFAADAGRPAENCAAVLSAWGGGVWDPAQRQLLIWGGGHADYAGNEVYGFSLTSGKWQRLTPPTASAQIRDSVDAYADGTPVSRHTYDSIAFLTNRNRMFATGGARWRDGGSLRTTWLWNPGDRTWQRLADYPFSVGSGTYYSATAFDSDNDRVLLRNDIGLFAMNLPTGQWSQLANFGEAPYFPNFAQANYRRGVFEPARKLFFALGGEQPGGRADVFVWDTATNTDRTAEWQGTGATEVIRASAPGADFDSAADAIVAFRDGAPAIWSLATKVWTRSPATGGPTHTTSNGIYGRWRYVPHVNAFVLVAHPDEDVWFFKHTAGCGAQ